MRPSLGSVSPWLLTVAVVWVIGCLPLNALAQPDPSGASEPVLVDRIVAIVDQEMILQSDLEREMELYRLERQAAGEEVTAKSDVYSLGLVAFGLLAGRSAFEETNPMALIAAHIKTTPPKLKSLRQDVDTVVADLVDRCLEKEAAGRPSSEELSKALVPEGHPQIEWPPPGLERMKGVGVRVVRLSVLLCLAVLAMMALGDGGGFLRTLVLTAILVAGVGMIVYEFPLEDTMFKGWRSGYPFLVLLDVALDGEPYTIELLNGLGPFATFPDTDRQRFMARRRWSAAVISVGILSTLVLVIAVAVRPSTTSAESQSALADAIRASAPFLLGLVIGRWLTRTERNIKSSRQRHLDLSVSFRKRIREDLVRNWLDTSERGVYKRPRRLTHFSYRWVIIPVLELSIGFLITLALIVVITPSSMLDPDNAAPEVGVESRTQIMAIAALDSAVAAMIGSEPDERQAPDSLLQSVMRAEQDTSIDYEVIWGAWENIDSIDSDTETWLRSLSHSERLRGWQAAAVFGRLSQAWYTADSFSANVDSASAQLARARSGILFGSNANSAASLVALLNGDTALAIRRSSENLRLGVSLMRNAEAGIRNAGRFAAYRGAAVFKRIGEVSGDSSLERDGMALQELLDQVRLSTARHSFAWLALLANPADLDTATIEQWRSTVADTARDFADRWQAYVAMSRGTCWNRLEILTGPAKVRREELEGAQELILDIPVAEYWNASESRRLSMIDGLNPIRVLLRHGYCVGHRRAIRESQ